MQKLKSLDRLQESFEKLPSIGKKSAERMAYAVLDMADDDIEEFSKSLIDLKKKIHTCPICGNLTENDVCDICKDEDRDQTKLMVVSFPKDVFSFESAENYKGLYHVLGGVISVSRGKTIDELNIPCLIERVKNGTFDEIILSTSPTIEGETTAIYLSKILKDYCPNITRLGYGLQMGGNLDYTDSLTLSKAIESRKKL